MNKRILLIQGHPDRMQGHLCHALADAYEAGAADAGHHLRHTHVAALDFPILRSQDDWEHGSLPPGLQQAQDDIRWAQHMVLFFPLWLGDMPALLKGFLEQVARPGFAFVGDRMHPLGKKSLSGRSARVVVTMGMPAPLYRWYFRAHGVKSLKRNILGIVGVAPVHDTLIGMVGDPKKQALAKWVGTLEQLGRGAA